MLAGSYRFQVGSICCTVLADGYFSFPPSWIFPQADPDQLSRALDRHSQQEGILSPYTCLLVETGRHVILVDTGAGAASPTAGALTARLETAGIRPKDVDTVILTHAHPDHIGGALNGGGRPAFPNARYMLSELEWEFWTSSHADLRNLRVPERTRSSLHTSARQCLMSLRHQTELISAEAEIVPGVRAIPAPGHTPGHLAVLLCSEGQELLNVGDAAVHPLHLERPEWENGFDSHPAEGIATRRALLDRASAGNMGLMAFHFPFPSIGRLARTPAGSWEWTPGW